MIKVTCAIILHKNRFLVTQRKADSDHPMMWEFPGGKIKEGELADKCIQREIKEELEIEIDILEEMKSVRFDYGDKKIELIPFLCSAKTLQIHLNDHVQYRWIQLKELETIDLLRADKFLFQNQINQKILKKYLGEQMNKPRKNTGPTDNR